MTRREIELAFRQMGDPGTFRVRLFLDNRTTVLAHEWDFVDEGDGLLRVVSRGRQATIDVNRIVVIERVPLPS
ncbi:MAG TPA: hypothetical protein VKP67_02115 [Xanthobacteraceae bacterium]|nr:hypothetical protein [Xanthobacteraceae bacterium]